MEAKRYFTHRLKPPRPRVKSAKAQAHHQRAWELRMSGLTYAEIAQQLGVSRQRAQQLVKPDVYIIHAVKRRAAWRCEECHVHLSQGHVHHRDAHGPTADTYNELDNLQYLCARCHVMAHIAMDGVPKGFSLPRGHKKAPRTPKTVRHEPVGPAT